MELGVEERLGVTFLALKAFLALPLALGDVLYWRVKTERMKGFVAHITV